MIIYPHTEQYELPMLDIRRQAKVVDLPVAGWGSVSRKHRFRGTWHFYVDDCKFTALWKHPESILATKAVFAVEPNFSTHQQMPFPLALYGLYQKRWLARHWQEAGMGIWVDLNVAEQYTELNLHGVPAGWQAYATNADDCRISTLMQHASLAKRHAAGNPIRMLVYGGGAGVAKVCEEHDWVHVRDARNEARDG